jgi:hypothetical protein
MRSAGAFSRHAFTIGLAASIGALSAQAHAQQPAPMRSGGFAPPPPMQSGGLAPPSPGSGPPPPAPMYPTYPNSTQRQLEEAEKSDSGRGLDFVYVDVAGGGQFVSLDALGESGSFFPPFVGDRSAFGPYFSAGAGLRLLFLTVGPSFRFARFTNWDLWTLNLDLGWHIPLGNLEPYAVLSGGFAKLGYRHDDIFGVGWSNPSTTGFNIRLGGGIDYYVTSVLSIGATLQFDLVRLSRGNVVDAAGSVVFAEAAGVGLAVTGGPLVGLHF